MTNYVLCESISSGVQSVFAGLNCPMGWIFIQYVQ